MLKVIFLSDTFKPHQATEATPAISQPDSPTVDYLKWVSETKRSTGNLPESSSSSDNGEKCSSSMSQESGFIPSSNDNSGGETEDNSNSGRSNRHGSPDSGIEHNAGKNFENHFTFF